MFVFASLGESTKENAENNGNAPKTILFTDSVTIRYGSPYGNGIY